MTWQVPLADVRLTEEDIQATLDVFRSGWLTMGPNIARFEAALAEYLGMPHAIAVSSGTAALQLALIASGVGEGDEVVVPDFTFTASAGTVLHAGGAPALCDVVGAHEPNLDPADVERRLTARTKAVIAVHFCGYTADMATLRRLCDDRGLVLIEDCAQAIAARTNLDGRLAGTVGEVGCFSFFSKKQLPMGEGGLVVTRDPAIAARVRSLRSHGLTTSSWDRHRGHADSYDVVDYGYNFRLDEPRAALGLSRLKRLDDDIVARRRVAERYRERLADVPGLELPWSAEDVARSSHFGFLVLLPDRAARDRFRAVLKQRSIQTTWYPALHGLSAFRSLAGDAAGLDRAEEVAGRHCALPMSTSMSTETLDAVAEEVRAAVAAAVS